MIHSWQGKQENPIDSEFIFPRYDGLSFANIPGTILNFFGLQGPNPPLKSYILNKIPKTQKLILILIDGLGFIQWKKLYGDYPILKTVSEKSDIFPLTSVFPSTTPAAITTMNSGLLPSEHGLLEWFVYFEEIDQVIQTLPFMEMGETTMDSLLKKGVDPKILFDGKTIYEKLSKKGIKSYAFLSRDYANSSYNKVAFRQASINPFTDLEDLHRKFYNVFNNETGPSYFYIYWGLLDSASHLFGPNSKEAKSKLKNFSNFLNKFLTGKELKNTTLLITADHGHTDINSKDTLMLNSFPKFEDNFALSKHGKKIPPSGNARDVFLKIKKDKLKDIKEFLQKKLNKKAVIAETTELIKMGLFGNKEPSKRFYQRIGNLLILPKLNNTVWYGDVSKRPNLLGHHGGLSREEMLIPFAILKLPF